MSYVLGEGGVARIGVGVARAEDILQHHLVDDLNQLITKVFVEQPRLHRVCESEEGPTHG